MCHFYGLGYPRPPHRECPSGKCDQTANVAFTPLATASLPAYQAIPYDAGKEPVAFNFDWSTNYYPLAYHRPGFEMIVYRLSGGKCCADAGSRE
jgi:hypothetical protein